MKKIIALVIGIIVITAMGIADAQAVMLSFYEEYTDIRYLGEYLNPSTKYTFNLKKLQPGSQPSTDASGYKPKRLTPRSATLSFDVCSIDWVYERIGFKLVGDGGAGLGIQDYWINVCNSPQTISFDLDDLGLLDAINDGKLRIKVFAPGTPWYHFNNFFVTRASLDVHASTPEPMSMALFGIGLLGTGILRKRKRG